MIQEQAKYEEWLTTIANTRLLYNTMKELEDFLDNHSIHNNGIKRCLPSPQKLRSAFRDMKAEVELWTDGTIELNRLMEHYKQAWNFFHDHLHRRTNPQQIALEMLNYRYSPSPNNKIRNKKTVIFQQIVEQEINIPFLVLMLMKAIPGYDSKDGDATNMPQQYEQVMQLLEQFTKSCSLFQSLPVISKAREEKNKNRIMLVYHVFRILHTYESYTENENIYNTATTVKEKRVNLDLVGFWNESEGQLLNTAFWQIENTSDHGSYFITYWRKDAENRLTGIRYSLFVIENLDGNLLYYFLHPEAILHRMKGQAYTDYDHTWYQTPMLESDTTVLPLQRMVPSQIWPLNISLTRCSDPAVTAQYEKWLYHECTIVNQYQHAEYDFYPNLYAITPTHLYIPAGEDQFYKIPKSSYDGFDCIKLGDNVGIMTMNNKTYLAFDELLLYIPVNKQQLKKYGIERVSHID